MRPGIEELRKKLEEIRSINRRLREGMPTTPTTVTQVKEAVEQPRATPATSRVSELQERARAIFERIRQRAEQRRRTLTQAPQALPSPVALPPSPPPSVQTTEATSEIQPIETGITLDEALRQFGAKKLFPTQSAYFFAKRVREGGRVERHLGIDFYLPKGTGLGAIESGIVDEAGYDDILGYFVRIDHGDYFTTVGHLERIPEGIRKGVPVQKGQLIGYVGNTGNAEGMEPHVHFITRRKSTDGRPGEYIDPSSVWQDFAVASLAAMARR